MQYKPSVDASMKRLEAFWAGGLADRPPIRVRYPVPGATDEQWPKASQDPASLFDYWDQVCRARADFPDDEIAAVHLDMGPGFMGGVMGSPVRFEHGTTWSEHSFADWTGLAELEAAVFDEANPWLGKLLRGARLFAGRSAGRCAVGLALMMGPADIATALRGPGVLCLDVFDHPAELRRLCAASARAWAEVAALQFDSVMPYRGGYVDNYNIWTPGRSTYFANDLSNLLSPEQYREHFFEYDARVAAAVDTAWMHVHSGGARLVSEFARLPGLVGIQIVNDRPAGPAAVELVPIFKLIQKKHRLLLRKYSRVELELILPELRPEGLYVDTQADSREEAGRVLDWWDRLWR